MQIFSLRRLRGSSRWPELVAQAVQRGGDWSSRALAEPGYADDGPRFCRLGEGMGLVYLLNEKKNRCPVDLNMREDRVTIPGWQRWSWVVPGWLYHEIPHHWTYMPWAVWLPSTGTGSLWASADTLWRLPADPVWSYSIFPGLSDFATLEVKCPGYLEDLASYIRAAMDTDRAWCSSTP